MAEFKTFINQREAILKEPREVVNLYLHERLKISEIASLTNRSIYRILSKNDINPNRLKRFHNPVKYFYESGLKTNDIAKITGYSPRNIRYIIKKGNNGNYK